MKKLYGLLGRALDHSWSVPIHAAAGNPDYQLFAREPEEVPGFLAREDLGGLNVTMPYKQTVMPLCDEIDPAARAVGSVNTLARRADGKLCAWNTDLTGFLFMVHLAGVELRGRKVAILGSGGASRAVQAAARELGAAEIAVISRRDAEKALFRHADAQIVVNATPVGMYPAVGAAAVDLRAFPGCRGVLDVVYNPRRTALLLQAEALGIPCWDGLPMLVAQATAAEGCFFNRAVPAAETLRILSLLRQKTRNIVLIGMPGCGKSSVGAALAALCGHELVDLDEAAVKAAGKSIPDLFAQDGEAAFRALESRMAAQFGRESGQILVTGGGVVTREENYAALRQNGRIYRLVTDVEKLARAGRPLSLGADLARMAAEREPLYARFQDTAIENRGTVEETAQAIWRDFCEHSGD